MKNYIDKADIEARIKDVNYLVMPDGRTTICTITMVNGFTVNGFSACVDVKNFDAALGRKYSYEDAFKNLWPLEGYLLAERIYRDSRGDTNDYLEEQLKWHAALKVELMNMLKISDPFNITAHVAQLLEKTPAPTVKEMVDRFLIWKLPKDFAPDAGISFKESAWWPTGTNLLHAGQAQEMIEFITGSTSQ